MEAPDCIFCDIVAGRARSSIVYETDDVLAFLDLRQVKHGHTLVIPKRHIQDILDLDDATGAALFAVLSRVAHAIDEALKPQGISIWQSNNPPWQEVPHLHFHVMPRHEGDGVLRIYANGLPSHAGRDELDRQAELIRATLHA
jgi:histidine triad (HIT) family protein